MDVSSARSTRFLPKKTENVTIGRITIPLYPRVDGTMSDGEKALAYQHNRTALANSDLDQRARILALADRLDLMLTAEASLSDWERKLAKNWFNFAHLEIISWHSPTGRQLNNTTDPSDPTVLLPVQDGDPALCRSGGVKFVLVQLSLDFADLNTVRGAKNTVLRGEYYIQLPQTQATITRNTGAVDRVSTYTGPGDLKRLSQDEVQSIILDFTHQEGPLDLLAPSFNASTCRTDTSGIYSELKSLVVKLASDTIHDQLFAVLVPGYSIEPHTVLDHIWQTSINPDGTTTRLGAQVYYSTFLNAIRSFYDLEEYPIDIAGIFMSHIDPVYAKGFRANYPDHGQVRPRLAIEQRRLLTEMLQALIKTEDNVSNILDIVGVDRRGGEQFFSPVTTPKSSQSPSAFPSVAENTINKYGGNDDAAGTKRPAPEFKLECFGCGSPDHVWSKGYKGNFQVICPRANEPGVQERAKLKILEFQVRKKKKMREFRKRKNVNTLNWNDIPPDRQEVLLQQQRTSQSATSVTVSSVSSSLTSPVPLRGTVTRSGVTLHQDVVVLAADPSKPPIPISIHSPMAHLTLQTGLFEEEKDCPGLRCVLDTGAALNTANYHFMEAVVRQFPHIVKQIYLPEDYAAIVLSGIVTSPTDGPLTTELSVGFELHLPYHTKDGSTTSLLVAAGPDVAVNVILGLPFIKATGMIADFVDSVCEAKNLCCSPFPIDFKRATKSIPAFTDSGARTFHSRHENEVLQVLDVLNEFYAERAASLTTSHVTSPPSSAIIPVTPKRMQLEQGGTRPKTIKFGMGTRWKPPSSIASELNDYARGVLEDLEYL